jgi:hypothetical protein
MDEYDEQRILDEYNEDAELLELCIQHTSDEVRAVLQRHKEMELSLGSCSQPVCLQHQRPEFPKQKKKKEEQPLIEGRMPSTYIRLQARQQVSSWLRKRSLKRKPVKEGEAPASASVPGENGRQLPPKLRFPSTGNVGSFEDWLTAQSQQGQPQKKASVRKSRHPQERKRNTFENELSRITPF